MLHIARRAIRHPRITIAVWLVLAIGLGFLGSTIKSHLSPTVLVPKGTESARASKLATDRFGPSVLTPVMLVGPAQQVDKQGQLLVSRLRTRSDVHVLSPWDGTPGTAQLRPNADTATIVVDVTHPEKQVIETTLPQIEQTVHSTVAAPVTSHITGQASIDRALRDQTLDQTRTALAIALPALLLMLLLVLRAPVAALVIFVFTLSVLAVGWGLTRVAADLIAVDPIAIPGAAMVGLAFAAGFGLLVTSRFRDDLRRMPAGPQASVAAAGEAAEGAARPALVAGIATVIAMILASVLSLTEIMNSVGIGATLMAFVAGVSAVWVLPAALGLTGPRVEAGQFAPAASAAPHRFAALPVAVAGVGLLAMIGLSVPVFSLGSGPPDARLLPPGNQARKDYEAVAKVMGPGWVGPFQIIVARHGAPVTTREFLAQMHTYETQTSHDAEVASVVGPGTLLTNANQLQGVPRGLNTAARTAAKSKRDLKKLIAGLQQATGGVAQVRTGLGTAASGAGQLHGGTGQAVGGSAALKAGLDQANSGARQLQAGARQASAGANQLAAGLGTAHKSVSGGLPAVQQLTASANQNAQEVGALQGGAQATKAEIATAANELAAMTVGRSDPHYAATSAAIQRAAAANDSLAAAITTAASHTQSNASLLGAVQQQVEALNAGLAKLLAGSNQLSSGVHQLATGNASLAAGIAKLDAGGAALQVGLRQLNTGAGQLATALAAGAGPTTQLLNGMHTITGSVVTARNQIPSTKDIAKLRKEAPGLFDSGYFVLAAIDGAPRPAQDAAAVVVNVSNGGTAGSITVVPKAPVNSPATRDLRDRLSSSAATFAKTSGAETGVGGTAGGLIDYRNLGLERLPIVIAALAALTVLVIVAFTRSPLLAGAAVLLSVLSATATFGVLTLLFNGSSPPLGGPGYIDVATIIAIVTLVSSLAISYEVFALARLRRITATAAVMLAVLLPFLTSDLTLVREVALGMSVAVVLDAAVVRPLLALVAQRRLLVRKGGERWIPQH